MMDMEWEIKFQCDKLDHREKRDKWEIDVLGRERKGHVTLRKLSWMMLTSVIPSPPIRHLMLD